MRLTHALAAGLGSLLLALPAAALSNPIGTAAASGLLAQEEEAADRVTHASSLWRKAKYDVDGSFRIVETRRGDAVERALVLSEDFETEDGPDLKVVLSPRGYTDVRSKNALEDGLVLGLLEDSSGASRFPIPAGTDLADYRSVLIHCEQYTVLWAAAPLGAGEIVAEGSSWVKKHKRVKGHFEIAQLGERSFELRIGADFDTSSAPDLKFVLSPHTTARAKNDNALSGGFVIAPLVDEEGAQSFRFELPEGRSLDDFESLLVHCERYTKLWGAVAL